MAWYITGLTAGYDQDDIESSIYEHVLARVYKMHMSGHVKQLDDLHLWKLKAEYVRDSGSLALFCCIVAL